MPERLPVRGCGNVENRKDVFHSSTALLLGKEKKGTFLMGTKGGHFYFALTGKSDASNRL